MVVQQQLVGLVALAVALQVAVCAHPFEQQVAWRPKRQVSMGAPPPQLAQQPPAGNPFSSFLSDLGPQVERAKAFSSLFSSQSSSAQQPQQNQMSSALNAAQLMGQLGELVRSTQDRAAKQMEQTSQQVSSVASQQSAAAANAATSAQGGITAALAEIGQGLQKIAANNPSLLPDVKNLYQSVSTKLSSAQSSVAEAAQVPPVLTPKEQQVSDSLRKASATV